MKLPGETEPLTRRCRRIDHDRYLMAGFAPVEMRPAMIALIAFNYEIGRVRDMVSEPMLGKIRLQWWRESLDGIYAGTPRSHDVVLALSAAISKHSLSRNLFDTIIDTRDQELDDTPPDDLPALLRYVSGTAGALNELMLEVIHKEGREALRELAAEVGTAWGLVGLLRAVPFHNSQGRVILPGTGFAEAGISGAGVAPGELRKNVLPVVATIADEAWGMLEGMRNAYPIIPRRARVPFLAMPLARYYLGLLRSANYDPWNRRVMGNPLGRLRVIGWAALSGRM